MKDQFQSVYKIVSAFNEEEAYIMPQTTVDSAVSLIKLNRSGFVQHLVCRMRVHNGLQCTHCRRINNAIVITTALLMLFVQVPDIR